MLTRVPSALKLDCDTFSAILSLNTLISESYTVLATYLPSTLSRSAFASVALFAALVAELAASPALVVAIVAELATSLALVVTSLTCNVILLAV